MDAAPGLCMIMRGIDASILQSFIAHHLPEIAADFDWTMSPEKIPEALMTEFRDNPSMTDAGRSRICALLYEVNLLSENEKDGRHYQEAIKRESPAMYQQWIFAKKRTAHIQNLATWINVNMPALWERLVTKKTWGGGSTSGGTNYYLPPTADIVEAADGIDNFKAEFKSYMKSECGLNLRIHAERNEARQFVRYCFHTDPFPKKEPQFADGGGDDDIDMGVVKRAECFWITVYPKKRNFRLKCDFNRMQKDAIASAFAEAVYKSKTVQKPIQQRCLDAFRGTPPKFDFSAIKEYKGHRYRGAYFKIYDGDDAKQAEEYKRSFPTGDFYAHLANSEIKDRPIETLHPQELYLEVTILSKDATSITRPCFQGMEDHCYPEKTYSLTIRPSGNWKAAPSPSEQDESTIERILSKMGLDDVSSAKVISLQKRQ